MNASTIAGMLLLSAVATLLAGCRDRERSAAPPPHDAADSTGTITPPLSIHVSGGNSGRISDATPQKGIPSLEPLLYLFNDTQDTLVVRHLGVPTAPAVIMAPDARFVAGLGGEFLGKSTSRKQRSTEIRRSPGILLAIFDEAGQERGHILYTSRHLYSGHGTFLCLSRAAQPAFVVDSHELFDNPPVCRPDPFAP